MTNWIVCPTLNNLHLTQRAVKSFLAQDIGEEEVDGQVRALLIDSGSSDGTPEWARSFPFTLFKTRATSVASAWNHGISWVFAERRQDYVLVCNNDVELHPATYRLLVEDGGGFVTGVGVTPEQFRDRMRLSVTQNSNPFLGEVHAFGNESFKDLHASRRPHPDFSCFLIRRWVWEKAGPFDEAYTPAFCEDCDMHVRLHRLGIEAYCLDIPFLHHGSATIKNMSDEEAQRLHQAAERNRDLFESKYGCRPGTPEYEELFK